MATEVGVVILGGGRGSRLEPLTHLRAKPAVPIGGKYRLVDIPISNAIHSGMEQMLLLTQFNSVSLHRHIQRTYQFDDFSRGWIQLIAAQQTPMGELWFQGTADAVRQSKLHVDELASDLVLILAGDHMYRMDYRELVRTHMSTGANITVAVQPCTEAEVAEFGCMRVDEHWNITTFREKPKTPEAREGMATSATQLKAQGLGTDKPYLASLGIYLFDKTTLMDCLDSDAVDFGRDVIPASVGTRKVVAHLHTGYWRDIGTIGAFFDAHMDLVKREPPFRFDEESWPIYTHPRYLPCARVTGTRLERTLLADGTRIADSTLEDAVIGIRTRIRKADIRRSLVMGADESYPEGPAGAPPVGIGEGTIIRNAIIDKNARIGRNVRIVNEAGVENAEGEDWVIRDGIVAIPKNGVIPDGTVI